MSRVFDPGIAGGGQSGGKAVKSDVLSIIIVSLQLMGLFPGWFIPIISNHAQGRKELGVPNAGRKMSFLSPLEAGKCASVFQKYRFAAVPVCHQSCGGQRCGSIAIVGQRWCDAADEMFVEFFGECCHDDAPCLTQDTRRAPALKNHLLDLARACCEPGANPSALHNALLDYARKHNPDTVTYGNRALFPSANVIRKTQAEERKQRYGVWQGKSPEQFWGGMQALREQLREQHTLTLSDEARRELEEMKAVGFVQELSMSPLLVVTRVAEALIAHVALDSTLRVFTRPVMVDSTSNQVAAPPGTTGKVYTTNTVEPNPQALLPDCSRHQSGAPVVLQRCFHQDADATIFRSNLQYLSDAVWRVGGKKGARSKPPQLIFTDDCRATRNGHAHLDGFESAEKQCDFMAREAMRYECALKEALSDLSCSGLYMYDQYDYGTNDAMFTLHAEAKAGRGMVTAPEELLLLQPVLPIVLQPGGTREALIGTPEEREKLGLLHAASVARARSILQELGIVFKPPEKMKTVLRPDIMTDKFVPALCVSHVIKSRFHYPLYSPHFSDLPMPGHVLKDDAVIVVTSRYSSATAKFNVSSWKRGNGNVVLMDGQWRVPLDLCKKWGFSSADAVNWSEHLLVPLQQGTSMTIADVFRRHGIRLPR